MNHALVTKFEAYLLTEKRVTANTFSAYKKDIEQLMAFFDTQKINLEQAGAQDVKNFLRHLKMTLNLQARSITRKISSLKVFFAYLHEYHGLKNLAEGLLFPKVEKKLPEYLSEQEVAHLLQIADADESPTGIRNKVMLYLLYSTGMRISELTNLTIGQFHFDTGFVDIAGKGGKGRMVPLGAPMLALVREYVEQTHRRLLGREMQTKYLFPSLYAGIMRPMTRQACWGIVRQLCKKAGIERAISPHKIRHSVATHLLKGGADLRSLQMLLGHENLATVQIYTHVETSYLRSVYDKKHPRS